MSDTATERSAGARWTGRQFHNQPMESHQHGFLEALWAEVAKETGGQVDITVHAQNAGVAGSDPQAFEMLQSGQLEFYTLMGGLLGGKVPAADVQGVPFAFSTHEQVHRANDGPLGELIGRECRAKGIHRFRYGLMENGFRHIAMIDKPIRTADDLAGVRMRIPDGDIFRELFTALGAEPVAVNINQLYDALSSRRVDGQENPLVVTMYNRLHEVCRYMSLTSHMWSGFNLLANLRFWEGLPEDVRQVIDRSVRKHVRDQRTFTDKMNQALETELAELGMVFNTADTESFRRKLGPAFYRRWRDRIGRQAWELLETEVGRLA